MAPELNWEHWLWLTRPAMEDRGADINISVRKHLISQIDKLSM